MGNSFNLSDYPDFLRDAGSLKTDDPKGEGGVQGTLPENLEQWYRGVEEQGYVQEEISPIEPQKAPKTRIRFALKNSLQILTVVVLIITAGILGAFVFLDRKVNLKDTQTSLNRMSDLLALETQAVGSGQKTASKEGSGEVVVPEIKSAPETRVFNTSANTNVATNGLPSEIDTDQDGLSDEVEERLGTNPFQTDTDGDGYPDGTEVKNGYDPTKPAAKPAPVASSGESCGLEAGVSSKVASASSCSLSSGADNDSASEDSYSPPSTFSSSSNSFNINDADFSGLTMDDYGSLQQFGLSENDINRAASGNVTDLEKIGMQETIFGSEPVQDSIGGIMGAIPKASLPQISDSELNLFQSNRIEDIKRYFDDVNNIFEGNFVDFKNLSGEAIRSKVSSGDYSELQAMHNSLEKTYEDLKALSTPEDAKEIHKGFVIMFQTYTDLVSVEGVNSDPEDMALVFAKMKSFEDLEPMMEQAFEKLASKYDFN